MSGSNKNVPSDDENMDQDVEYVDEEVIQALDE